MRVIKMLGAALISCAAFIGVSANAQQVPVSCNLVLISSDGPPNGSSRYITHQCKEANGNVVATRNLVWTQAANGYTSCTISTSAGITWTGTCLSPSFYRSTASSSSAQSSSAAPVCANAGLLIYQGCTGGIDNIPVATACGNYCSLRVEVVGATNGCGIQNPFAKVYCK